MFRVTGYAVKGRVDRHTHPRDARARLVTITRDACTLADAATDSLFGASTSACPACPARRCAR